LKAFKSIKPIDKLNKRLDTIEKNDEQVQQKKTPSEARYQALKKAWYFHESSW
jgi:hypothetical protein